MRLDKMLSNMGYGTRNEIKKAVRAGWISVNGNVIKKSDMQVDPFKDEVFLADQKIVYTRFTYMMMNKPAGVISATEGRDPTVLDLIEEPVKGLFPAGRLDKDTEGLLLITNDGQLAHSLLSPKKHVEKEYLVDLKRPIESDYEKKFSAGIRLNQEEKCQPAKLIPVSEKECHLIIQEGKFHEIKRMFLTLGNEVTYLKRLRMKNLVLDPALKPGEYRQLSEEELNGLRKADH